jgi:hypothetical protein
VDPDVQAGTQIPKLTASETTLGSECAANSGVGESRARECCSPKGQV